MNTASSLLLSEVDVAEPGSRLLVIGGEAELAMAVVDRVDRSTLTWIPFDSRELARLGDSSRIQVHREPTTTPSGDALFDMVLIPGVPDRDVNRRSLAMARLTVSKQGWVTIAGANNEGVRSFLTDAQATFGDPFFADYRARHRYATFEGVELTETYPDWCSAVGVAPGTWIESGLIFLKHKVLQATTAGVFSADGLDDGTRLLLESLDVRPGQTVLDVGAGSGIIGAYAARAGGEATLVDANLIAVATARHTMEINEFTGYRVLAGDTYDPVSGERFDLIVSNPPFHRGKKVDYGMAERLIDEAPQHLTPGGRLILVANAFLPYSKRMQRVFGGAETIAANRRYHVLAAGVQGHPLVGDW
jgi:16S rRNA (guanine1207-N2)-methyltransferase